MEKIDSFKKNHDALKRGFYACNVRAGVTTFDVRFKTPNGGDYLSTAAAHTVEHLLATLLRNGKHKDDIIYFGPMGCRTGFYLLTINMDFETAKNELIDALKQVEACSEVFGSKREECGNYLDHDLPAAKRECADYLKIICCAADCED